MIVASAQMGSDRGLKPLTVTVLNAGGHLLVLQRQDGSSTLRPQIAVAKASGSLALGVSSRKIAAMAIERPAFVGSLAPHSVVQAAGGTILVDDENRPVGTVGVTGDTSDNDEACAFAGIAAAGLAAQD